ncbi:MAG: beta-propeller fold lactonase family protein [bacterium]
MNEIFFVLVLLFSLSSGYFLFLKQDKNKFIIAVIIALKLMILWVIAGNILTMSLLGLTAIVGIITAFIAVLVFSNYDFLKNESKLRFAYIIVALVFLVLFASGCTGNTSNFPRVTGELNLGFIPSKILSPVKNELYVASERNDFIEVFNLSTKSKKTIIPTGKMPTGIIVNNGILFSANKNSNTITIHNLENAKAVTVYSGGSFPCALAVNHKKNLLYVANMGSNNVSILDLSSKEVNVENKIAVGKWPSDLYLSPDNRYLYVCCKYTNTIQVIDVEKEQLILTKVNTGISPSEMVAISNRDIAIINEWEYAYNHQSTILVFDRINYNLKYDMMVEGGIFDAVLSKSKRYMYISVPVKDKVIFVDLKQKRTIFELNFKDDTPRWLALSTDKKTLYVATQHTGKIFTVALRGVI